MSQDQPGKIHLSFICQFPFAVLQSRQAPLAIKAAYLSEMH